MHLDLVGKNIVITPSLKRQLSHKFQRLDKFLPLDKEVRLVLSKVKDVCCINARMSFPKKHVICAIAETDDMYKSIDIAANKLRIQMLSYKDKLVEHH